MSQLLGRRRVPFMLASQIAPVLGGITLVLACVGLYDLVSDGVLGPLIYAATPLALLAACVVAVLVPARRAAAADPLVDLRHD